MALILYQPLFWVLLAAQVLFLLWLARRLHLRWPPASLLRMGLVGLVLLVAFFPGGDLARHDLAQRQVMVVDQSDSLPAHIRRQVQDQARQWQVGAPNRLVVAFGSQAQAVLNPQGAWPEVAGRGSDLAAALELAADLLGREPGRIILASDGLAPSAQQVQAVVDRLAGQGHLLEVIPLPSYAHPQDLSVGPLLVPSALWQHTPFTIVLPVHLPEAGQVALQLLVNGELVSERTESLPAGENYATFMHQALTQEIMTLEGRAILEGDPRPANNQAYAVVQVFPAPRVLFISQQEDQAAQFLEILNRSGLQVDLLPPTELPTELKTLQEYEVIFLHDLLSESLSREQMLALQVFVSRQGGGLIFVGGRHSYTLGGYQNTVLEPMMPVKLEPPPRKERPPVTFVLVLDRSGSMGFRSAGSGGALPIELAREAAIRAVEILNNDDFVGVLTYSDEAIWDVPIGQVGAGLILRQAMDTISQIRSMGRTRMEAGLAMAIADLEEVETGEARYILLLSDGISTDGSFEGFRELAQKAKEQGITISTIALGTEADEELMAMIAAQAGGRYHLVVNPAELPRIMITESRAARSENVQRGRTTLAAGEPAHPVLSGLRPAELPALEGYHALTSKVEAGAEDILISAGLNDPLLSAWQYGLGRVIAWMGDLGEEWALEWEAWPNYGLFWSQVVRYAWLNPALGPAQVEVSAGESSLAVDVRIQDEQDLPVNFARPQFSFVGEAGSGWTHAVPQAGPGQYRLEIPLPDEGAYRGRVAYQVGGQNFEIPAFFALNYPLEWRPGGAEAGRADLLAWAQATGGGEVVGDLEQTPRPAAQQPLVGRAWWRRVLLAAVLLWPVEIALRRRFLPWA